MKDPRERQGSGGVTDYRGVDVFKPNPAVIEWAERHGLDPTRVLPDIEARQTLPGESLRFRVDYTRVADDGRREACVLYTDEEPPPTILFPKSPDWHGRALAAEAKVARVEALAHWWESLDPNWKLRDPGTLAASAIRKALAGTDEAWRP